MHTDVANSIHNGQKVSFSQLVSNLYLIAPPNVVAPSSSSHASPALAAAAAAGTLVDYDAAVGSKGAVGQVAAAADEWTQLASAPNTDDPKGTGKPKEGRNWPNHPWQSLQDPHETSQK
eukprot:1159109-Pelagomonas_calceolata.AAC.5